MENHFFKEVDLNGVACDEFVSYYTLSKDKIDEELDQFGALKYKGVHIETADDFKFITDSISEKFVQYIDGTSPRTKVDGHVYTSTEYDATQRITMHNELSYSAVWPTKLYFSCLEEPESGGETLISSSSGMLDVIDKDIVDEIEAKGVTYYRNLHSGKGLGLSWKDAFETNSKDEVEKHCKNLNIEFNWKSADLLQIIQRSKGVIHHRRTGQKVWFNQIDQFHPYQLGEELYNAMQAMYSSPEDFPTYVIFGDGTEIPVEVIKEILSKSEEITIAPFWSRNELLIVDNELASHGRNPYTGSRKVLVAMSK